MKNYLEDEMLILLSIELIVFLWILVYTCLHSRHTILLAIAAIMALYSATKMVELGIVMNNTCCDWFFVFKTSQNICYMSGHWLFSYKYIPTAALISKKALPSKQSKRATILLSVIVFVLILIQSASDGYYLTLLLCQKTNGKEPKRED